MNDFLRYSAAALAFGGAAITIIRVIIGITKADKERQALKLEITRLRHDLNATLAKATSEKPTIRANWGSTCISCKHQRNISGGGHICTHPESIHYDRSVGHLQSCRFHTVTTPAKPTCQSCFHWISTNPNAGACHLASSPFFGLRTGTANTCSHHSDLHPPYRITQPKA